MTGNSPIDYSKTNRILLLIDLTPVFRLQNPKPYMTSVIASAKTLIGFSPLSHSLSSFKFFFSSLSPIISESTLVRVLPFCPNTISFCNSDETLGLLVKVFDSIGELKTGSVSSLVSKVSYISSSIAQVLHDYAWDLYGNEDVNSLNGDGSIGVARSNLVVLFSPISQSYNDLCECMEDNDMLSKCDDNAFCDKFRRVFRHVRDAFVSRDIHFSWVDVRYELDYDIGAETYALSDEYNRLLLMFRNGVNGLGWGFCSSGLIALGSAVMPFGLIYPMIGVSSLINSDVGDNKHKKISGQLNLEILDVSEKPLECKYCDLQLVDLKTLPGRRLNELSLILEPGKGGRQITHQISKIWERFGNGMLKIDLKGLCQHSELGKTEEQTYDVVLVQELLAGSKKINEDSSQQFFTDRVLGLLSAETGKSAKRKSPPLWQILLSFLYRRGYWALVSLSNADGSSTLSVLKPFTVHSALLCIPKKNADSQYNAVFGLNGLTLRQCTSETAGKIEPDGGIDSKTGITLNDGKSKHKKHRFKYKDLSWSSFCKAAFELCEMELEEACFFGGSESSKKLKFLKCWMKQVVKNSSLFRCSLDLLQNQENFGERLHQSQEESKQPLAFSDRVNEALQQEATPLLSEVAEAFFNNLPQRIQHGIESEVDLLAFAQRIVHSCIYWFSRKLGPETNEKGEASVKVSNDSFSRGLVHKIIKILLVEPKDVARKHKETDQSSKPTDSNSSKSSSENKLREYELQILFRMEILQSELAVGIRESSKNKFVKQICSLLEFIQCSMEDGFFGDFNLSDFIGKIISARYTHNLAGVVHSIYEQMDLLLFDDEDESPNLLLNSEESNQSWRMGSIDKGSEPNSTEDSFSGNSRDYEQIPNEMCHERKLIEAQERRKRASRLSSSTRRAMPDLQRVWAPKPTKLSRSKSESFRRPKRKSHRESYDNVCETPMSGATKSNDSDQEGGSTGIAKRLSFQDDLFQHEWTP